MEERKRDIDGLWGSCPTGMVKDKGVEPPRFITIYPEGE